MKLHKCSAGGNKDQGTDGKELDEDEMVRRAITMSLEEQEEELKGELPKKADCQQKQKCSTFQLMQTTRCQPPIHLMERKRMRKRC